MSSYWVSDDWSVQVKTFEGYMRDAMKDGAIDHLIRAQMDSEGTIQFYIHPANQDGETIDYKVDGNQIYPADPKFSEHHGGPLVMFMRMKSGSSKMMVADSLTSYISGLEDLKDAVEGGDQERVQQVLQDLREACEELGE